MNKKQLTILIITALILGAVIFLQKPSPSTSEETTTTERNEEKSSSLPTRTVDSPATKNSASLNEDQKKRLEEIREELSEAKSELTTIEEIKELSEDEIHHTPTILVESGKLIGRLISKAEAEPLRREETLKFFLGCAENSELPESLRATCWKSTMNLIPKWKVFIPISNAKVSDEVKELATRLP